MEKETQEPLGLFPCGEKREGVGKVGQVTSYSLFLQEEGKFSPIFHHLAFENTSIMLAQSRRSWYTIKKGYLPVSITICKSSQLTMVILHYRRVHRCKNNLFY